MLTCVNLLLGYQSHSCNVLCIMYCIVLPMYVLCYYDHVTCLGQCMGSGGDQHRDNWLLTPRPQFRVEMSLKLSKTVVAAVVGVVAGVGGCRKWLLCCCWVTICQLSRLVITAPPLTADRGHCSLPPTFLYRSTGLQDGFCHLRS